MEILSATYYNLNKTYIFCALVIFFLCAVGLFWLITVILAKQDSQSCKNPVAQFFDRRLKQKCMAKQWENNMGWFANEMQDKFIILHQTQDYLNSRIDDVLGKYTAENTADFQSAMTEIQRQEEEMIALRNKAVETQQLAVQNTSMLRALWNTWQQRLGEIKEQIKASLFAKRDAANGYVDKLNQIQRNKKAKNKRKKLVKNYDKTKKYLQSMSALPDYANLDLSVAELSADARRGRK